MKDLKAGLRKKILDAIRSGKIAERDGIYRFSESIGGIPRGTVVIGKRVVYGYPKIRRVFSLGKGALKNLGDAEAWAEEKIDGYNLRVVHCGGKTLCISRGGFLDYFACEKISDSEPVKAFFAENPDKVLYAEMVGNTPYTRPEKKFDTKYYVFDIGDGKNGFVQVGEKRETCREFGLEAVPLAGKMKPNEAGKLRRAAAMLEKKGAEGMVLKQDNPRRVVKYVVPSSEIRDLEECSHMIFDMPLGFMKQRVFRCALSVSELKLDKKQYARKLGEALHSRLHGALREGAVATRFEVRVKSRGTWKKILEHMSGEVRIEVDYEYPENGALRIGFRKVYKNGSRKVRRAVEGYAQTD